MRELELAVHPTVDPTRVEARTSFPSPRTAFVVSVVVHLLAGYALSLHVWPGARSPQSPTADFFLFEMPRPPEPLREAVPVKPAPEIEEQRPAPEPPQRAAEAVPESTVVVVEPPPAVEPAPATQPVPAPFVDFDEERRRAAEQIVSERAEESEHLTFSIDDVAPPRPVEEPEPERSIFDGGPSFGGRSVLQPGQARTKLGRKILDLCNALTGGFGVAFQGFGLFSACASPDGGPSGLFPEVRPAYLDLMPECVDTRDTAPALALESPFSTVKCRLVRQEEPAE